MRSQYLFRHADLELGMQSLLLAVLWCSLSYQSCESRQPTKNLYYSLLYLELEMRCGRGDFLRFFFAGLHILYGVERGTDIKKCAVKITCSDSVCSLQLRVQTDRVSTCI